MSATLETVIEVLMLASGRALKIEEILELTKESAIDADRAAVKAALEQLGERWQARGLELREVASGYRLQVRSEYAPWLSRLWAERPARYSRALLETLALIAYRQPITRGEIEDVRGVSVSQNIVKTLLEREWVRVLGHREVPGRPAIYGTTRTFLDDFNLTGLEDLPPLAEVRDIDRFHDDLFKENSGTTTDAEGTSPPAAGDNSAEPPPPDDDSDTDATGGAGRSELDEPVQDASGGVSPDATDTDAEDVAAVNSDEVEKPADESDDIAAQEDSAAPAIEADESDSDSRPLPGADGAGPTSHPEADPSDAAADQNHEEDGASKLP